MNSSIGISLFVAFTFLYLFTTSIDAPGIGDSAAMFEVSKRILKYGFNTIPGIDNADSYSIYGLGQSLINLTVTWAYIKGAPSTGMTRLFYTLVIASVSAMTVAAINVVLFFISLRLGYSRLTGIVLGCMLGLTTMIWVYSQGLYSDLTITLLWLLAFFCAVSFKLTAKKFWLTASGIAIGYSLITKIISMYIIPLFLIYYLYIILAQTESDNTMRVKRKMIVIGSNLGCYIIPLIVFLGILVWYNYIRYHDFFASGYHSDRRTTDFGFNNPLLIGLYGLLFSSGCSLFLFCPSTLIGILNVKKFYTKFKTESLLILAIIIGNLIIVSKWWCWGGGWSWGPRLIIPTIPFFILLAAPWIDTQITRIRKGNVEKKIMLLIGIVLVSISFLVQIPGLCVDISHYIWVVTRETGFFEYPYYDENVWPIKNDTVYIHFIPEFSPVVGHIWMMRCIYHHNSEKQLEIFRSPPWKQLNTRWIPKHFDENHFYFNIWWMFALQYHIQGLSIVLFLAAVFLVISLCFFGLAIYFAYNTP